MNKSIIVVRRAGWSYICWTAGVGFGFILGCVYAPFAYKDVHPSQAQIEFVKRIIQ